MVRLSDVAACLLFVWHGSDAYTAEEAGDDVGDCLSVCQLPTRLAAHVTLLGAVLNRQM